MQCGNDLLIAGVGYVANSTVRRLIWNKPNLNVLSGAVIRDGRAFTPTTKTSRKQKHFARSAHWNAPPVRGSFAFASGSGPVPKSTDPMGASPAWQEYAAQSHHSMKRRTWPVADPTPVPMFCVSDCSQGDGIEDERHGQRAANRPAQEPNRLSLVHDDSSPKSLVKPVACKAKRQPGQKVQERRGFICLEVPW
jgi:hypothetical protein